MLHGHSMHAGTHPGSIAKQQTCCFACRVTCTLEGDVCAPARGLLGSYAIGHQDRRTCSMAAISGATSLQGPHQLAQKSTKTGLSLCRRWHRASDGMNVPVAGRGNILPCEPQTQHKKTATVLPSSPLPQSHPVSRHRRGTRPTRGEDRPRDADQQNAKRTEGVRQRGLRWWKRRA